MIKWDIKRQDEKVIDDFTSKGIHPVLARLLYNRGFKDIKSVESFLNVDRSALYSPYLLPDIKPACKRIQKAIDSKEIITVFGDYDVDGITSVVVLYKYLERHGLKPNYYIPDRKDEGYGLNCNALDKIKENGTTLVITVDTGTTAVEEVEYAKEIGLDIIVTDHHECKDKIPDCPLINPKRPDSEYPFKELAGVGVVFKLISALSGEETAGEIFDLFGGFAAIGTVADIMPLVDENRVIVAEGLKMLKNPPVGINALLNATGNADVPISTNTISYRLAPRLNAAGRIGDPGISVEVLLSENFSRALDLANILCEENTLRQQTEYDILKDVEHRLKTRKGKLNNIIVEASENWHNGVIGIVASRLVDLYNRPCVLFCLEGDKAKGSGRSIKGINIFELLQQQSQYLTKFGGHEMAAGLTMDRDNYDDFAASLYKYADENIDLDLLLPVIESECILDSKYLNLDFYDILSKMEPFGPGNQQPQFTVQNLEIVDITGVSQNKHTRIILSDSLGNRHTAMYFGHSPSELSCFPGDMVDIICSLGENVYRGVRSLSITIKNLKFVNEYGKINTEYIKSYNNYKLNNTELTEDLKINRQDVENVFKYLRRQTKDGYSRFSPIGICRTLSKGRDRKINFCRLHLCLDVLSELELCTVSFNSAKAVSEDNVIEITFNESKKVDLLKSETYINASEK